MDSDKATALRAEIGRLQGLLEKRELESTYESKRLVNLEAMPEGVPVGVVVFEKSGRVMFGNSGVERLC